MNPAADPNSESNVHGRWTTAQLTVTVRFVGPARATEASPANSAAEPGAAKARQFVVAAELAEPPAEYDLAQTGDLRFDAAKEQAAVVGSALVSFVKGVSHEQRSDIIKASLLAQLAANRKVASPATVDELNAWYGTYFDVLSQIGFAAMDRSFAPSPVQRTDFDAGAAILDIATTLLAESSEALSLVRRTLDALRKMPDDNPSLALLNRASQATNTSRFQMTVVDQEHGAGLRMFLMAFGLEAKSGLMQLPFFRVYTGQVTVQRHSARFAIDAHLLAAVGETIARRVDPYGDQHIRQLPDL
ncbi:hypothetical protein [Accumulibacter sp.]|uniref:hypothetical protein n=1 Tax=Accumulibacter sp. TaxID=2053492 RepID=UPI001D5639AA|nr:hypothetical protein [Accumulibacter sp.]MCB1967917.1 hypothetical protein [Accumulibacter sp.]MCP5227676.1 hypothetical protein [Accumulibacter sp.]